MRNYFIFSGQDSRDFNLHLAEYPPEIIPEKRVEIITVAGRSGTLHINRGEDVFESYNIPLTLTVLDPSRLPEIKRWLHGQGQLSFGNNLDYYYEAYIVGQTEFTRTFRQWHQGTVVFEVQPFKKMRIPQVIDLTFTNITEKFYVETDIPTLFSAELTLNTQSREICTFTINGNSLEFPARNPDMTQKNSKIFIDFEKKLFVNENNKSLFESMRGNIDSFKLNKGLNSVRTRAVSEVIITTRGQFL